MSEFPVPVRDLEKFVPHRPPMVWLDEVYTATAEGGECRVRLTSGALYLDGDTVRPSSYLEWMAQATGFVRAIGAKAGVTRAFLVGVRELSFFDVPSPQPGTILTVRVATVRELGPVALIRGEVLDDKGACLAAGTLKLFAD